MLTQHLAAPDVSGRGCTALGNRIKLLKWFLNDGVFFFFLSVSLRIIASSFLEPCPYPDLNKCIREREIKKKEVSTHFLLNHIKTGSVPKKNCMSSLEIAFKDFVKQLTRI